MAGSRLRAQSPGGTRWKDKQGKKLQGARSVSRLLEGVLAQLCKPLPANWKFERKRTQRTEAQQTFKTLLMICKSSCCRSPTLLIRMENFTGHTISHCLVKV